MRELLGRALDALKSLKPQQQNEGAGSVQIGKAGGSVKVVNINQAAPVHQEGGLQVGQVHGSVTHSTTRVQQVVQQVVHQHFYAVAPATGAVPNPESHPERQAASPAAGAPPVIGTSQRDSSRSRPPLTDAHREVLALLDGLPQRTTVLDFMEREFGTRMVIDLTEQQVYRTKRYVETIKKACASKSRARRPHPEFL